MTLFRTSASALAAAGLLAGAVGVASACEWQKQVMAKAPTAPAEQTTTNATPVDPTVLARAEATAQTQEQRVQE